MHVFFKIEVWHGRIATNSGLGGRGSNQDLFCIVSTRAIQKSLMFLHHVNNIEHNLKPNIYTGMEVIFFYLHDTVCKNSENKNVLINNISNYL